MRRRAGLLHTAAPFVAQITGLVLQPTLSYPSSDDLITNSPRNARRDMFGDAALGALNLKMVATARAAGAAAKFTGSGGAIVAFCPLGERQEAALKGGRSRAGRWRKIGGLTVWFDEPPTFIDHLLICSRAKLPQRPAPPRASRWWLSKSRRRPAPRDRGGMRWAGQRRRPCVCIDRSACDLGVYVLLVCLFLASAVVL